MSPEVTLLTRTDCPACATAEVDLRRICGELGVAWTASDVDADRELRAEYGDRVPVILIDGREHGFWKVEEERFRVALSRSGGAPPLSRSGNHTEPAPMVGANLRA